jgi:hypothetical protein
VSGLRRLVWVALMEEMMEQMLEHQVAMLPGK